MCVTLSDKTIAVIGGMGFVGRALCEKLASAGARLFILARNAERAKQLKLLGAVGQITAFSGNALDDEDLGAVISQADMVVNLVGILAPSGRQQFAPLQAELPQRIGRLASAHGCEAVVHLSALGAALDSPSIYARTKAEGERGLLRQYRAATILQPSVIFGPGDGFFNRFGQMAMLSPALPLIGGGQNKMQPVFVGDVADAIVAILQQPALRGKIYQLGGPKTYSFADLMAYTLAVTARRRWLVPVPFALIYLPAVLAGLLPQPPITTDQLKLLRTDNICAKSANGFARLGISPSALETIVPSYLSAFRPGGRFSS